MRHGHPSPVRTLASLAVFLLMIPAASGVEYGHIEILKGRFRLAVPDAARGRLAVIDGQVVFTPSVNDLDLWSIDILHFGRGGANTIQARGGRWDGWFLTASATGTVYLAPRAEAGSRWSWKRNTAGGINLRIDGPGQRSRAMAVDDRPSTLTDRDGFKHVIYALRLARSDEGRAPAELFGVSTAVAPPAPAPGKLGGVSSSAAAGRPPVSLVNTLLFHPHRYPQGDWDIGDASIEAVWFKSADGFRINGWFAAATHPRAVVLYAEGNAGNITGRRWVLKLFRDRMNASVLIFDYRGYGRSEGWPSTSGILADARAARHWLADRAGVPERSIVLVGHSLGGAVVVDLAAHDGARGLVLENTFSSLSEEAAVHFGRLPARVVVRNQLDSASSIRDYKGPLLQTHGDADQVIPYELGRRLFEAANEPKQFVRILDGDHNDPPTRAYLDALDHFLDMLPPRR